MLSWEPLSKIKGRYVEIIGVAWKNIFFQIAEVHTTAK